MRKQLLSRVTVVTPNIAEAAVLAEMPVDNVESMKAAARKLVELGARAVVVTGGRPGKSGGCFSSMGTTMESFAGDRIKPDNTHGNRVYLFLCRGRQPRTGAPASRRRRAG